MGEDSGCVEIVGKRERSRWGDGSRLTEGGNGIGRGRCRIAVEQ